MNLVIDNPDNLDLFNFCNWLIPKIRGHILNSINKKLLIKWDKFLNSSNILQFNKGFNRPLSTKDLIIASLYYLRVSKNANNSYIIEIDPNRNIPNSSAKFINIIKLIDKGNLSISPYNIITKTMNYFANNLQDYYQSYLEEAN